MPDQVEKETLISLKNTFLKTSTLNLKISFWTNKKGLPPHRDNPIYYNRLHTKTVSMISFS